ncbi:GNAT family N-acetyltransferase [Marimonas sp. MJW-29]|uniref:GNAT family N-acetyltransferase n=1 Tax=Sulfitobacter sediminis TaxID=3234186 RepID=A0ABV3RP90_9RHOB
MAPARSVRALTAADAEQALVLYNELTVGPPADDPAVFSSVIGHQGTEVFGAFEGDRLAAMVTLHLLPNAVWSGRPYGLIENVVTRASHQRRGFGRMAMQAALDAAQKANAHKLMLLTGVGRDAVGFYEAMGFSARDKTGMVIRYP